MRTAGGESERHRDLKRRAVLWAMANDFRACATEVRVPRSSFRADVAAARVRGRREPLAGETVVFECKQARSDLLRDTADERETVARLAEISARRRSLEQLVGAHLPNLRRGETLFAECDDYDLDAIRHDGLRAVRRAERRLQAKLFGGTKFDRLRRYRVADQCFLVVAEDVLAPHEAPEGWGVLVVAGDDLKLARAPVRLDAGAAARLALLQAIALAGTRQYLAGLEIAWDELAARRARTLPP
jgi:hypothetical protein